MCELFLVSLGNERLNRILLYNLAVVNSSESNNKDGFGCYSPKEDIVWKTHLQASIITNLGENLFDIAFGERPIMGHVRYASSYAVGSIIVNRLIDDLHAHPFEAGKYIVAHNGTLEFKDRKKEDIYKGKDVIDSQAFAIELSLNKKPFVEALKETIALFYGKFAFLIYDRESKTQYAVRGKIAPLHKVDIKYNGNDIGYAINTLAIDLKEATKRFKNQVELLQGGKFEITEPVELEADSIFVATSKFVKKVDTVTETTKVTYAESWPGIVGNVKSKFTNLSEYEKMVESSVALMRKHGLILKDLDEMCFRIYGEPLLGLTEVEIIQFARFIFPAICSKNYEKLVKKWRQIREYTVGETDYAIIVKYNLEYPYFFNSMKKLRSVCGAAAVEARRQEDLTKKKIKEMK